MSNKTKNFDYFSNEHDLFDDYANVQREIEKSALRLRALRSRVQTWPASLLTELDMTIADLDRHHDRISSLKNS